MKYQFLHHTLDTKTSELSNSNGNTLLKQKPFLLLQCLVQNPQQILSKDFLMAEVWNDRFVTDNTIAQTVGQLRQLVEVDSKNPEIIVTHRGRGISFTPAVEITNDEIEIKKDNDKQTKIRWVIVLLIMLSSVILWWFTSTQRAEPPQIFNEAVPNLLFLSAQRADASETWLQNSVSQVISNLWYQKYKGKVSAELLSAEADLSNYLNNKWNINPNLNVVTTDLLKSEFGYTLSLDLTLENQISQSQRFTGSSVNDVLQAASNWLGEELNTQIPDFSTLLPGDTAVVELYMRGVAAEKASEYEKASQYFELVLTERPEFHMARLQLADVKKHQGENDAALVLLDTLENTTLYPQIELQAVVIRSYIYDIQGRLEEAKTLFQQTLDKHAQAPAHQLNPIRFELSYIFTNLNQLDQALYQLDQIEQTTTLASDPLLYADTLQKKASIFQSMGRTSEALNYAEQSLNTYLKLGELLGVAKTNNLMARIYTMKSDFEKAKYHLFETLSITRKMGYRLGTGASINELVYLLIREGDFDQAEKLTAEMEQIAIEIDYTHMLIGAKQHAATLAINRGEWQVAEQFLEQQEQLASSSNHQTALMTSRLLYLEYLVTKGSSEGAEPILSWLKERINKQQNLRQHIALELRRAQLKLIDGQQQSAIDLLVGLKGFAESAEDFQTLVEINNTLTEIYLTDQTDKALSVIEENKNLRAVDYPYLLLYSKALKANEQLEQSLAVAIECKNKSGQHWSREDEAYLSQLRLLVK